MSETPRIPQNKTSSDCIKPLLTPLEAAQCETGDEFFTSFPLREWKLVKRIKQMNDQNMCGELCSLRFTWQRPKQDASNEQTFLYETLVGLLDIAWILADSPLSSFFIEKVDGNNNLFGLLMFENGIAAEIEANECLPNSMQASNFIKANFKHGHLTNQPLVGHFNEEGSILADDVSCQRLVIENSDWDDCGDEIALCRRSMLYSIKHGTYPSGPLHSVEIVNAVKAALEKIK
jgi:hypothetical protein